MDFLEIWLPAPSTGAAENKSPDFFAETYPACLVGRQVSDAAIVFSAAQFGNQDSIGFLTPKHGGREKNPEWKVGRSVPESSLRIEPPPTTVAILVDVRWWSNGLNRSRGSPPTARPACASYLFLLFRVA